MRHHVNVSKVNINVETEETPEITDFHLMVYFVGSCSYHKKTVTFLIYGAEFVRKTYKTVIR